MHNPNLKGVDFDSFKVETRKLSNLKVREKKKNFLVRKCMEKLMKHVAFIRVSVGIVLVRNFSNVNCFIYVSHIEPLWTFYGADIAVSSDVIIFIVPEEFFPRVKFFQLFAQRHHNHYLLKKFDTSVS